MRTQEFEPQEAKKSASFIKSTKRTTLPTF